MKKLLIVVIILLLAVLMTMTVPTKQTHKDAMMEAVKEFVDEEADNRFGDNVLTDIGKSVAVKTVELALNTKLKEHNYLVLNTTYVKLNGEEHMLSLGMFGHVFTFDKEAKEEAASEKEAAKMSARELKKLEREQRKRERELAKEQKRKEKEARKEAKRKEKEARKEAKRKEKEAREKSEGV